MIHYWSRLRAFVHPGTTDMRRWISGLATLARTSQCEIVAEVG